MKAVIQEYTGMIVALITTCLFLGVMGGILFQPGGMLSQITEAVLEGGV